MDYSEKFEEEPEQVIRRLKYESDLLKHSLNIANRQKEELSIQVQGMRYSSSCPSFPPYLASSPRGNPLSPNRGLSSPTTFFPIDEDGEHVRSRDGVLIPASYPGHFPIAMGMRSASSSPTTGMLRPHGLYMSSAYGSATSLPDIMRIRPSLRVNTAAPRSRANSPPVSPQQPSPNLSTGDAVLGALDSIASSFNDAIRSDLQLLGFDVEEYENPDKKQADELQAEVERLQRVLEIERQERRGLDCRVRELENIMEGLKHEKLELMQQVSTLAGKADVVCRSGSNDAGAYQDESTMRDQAGKSKGPGPATFNST